MYRTPQQTAIGIAFILKRSDQTRARISEKTIRLFSKRKRLRGAFIVGLISSLADLGWSICELDSGGYGAIQTKSLEAAKSVTASKLLTEDEKKALRRSEFDFDDWEAEAKLDEDDPDEPD